MRRVLLALALATTMAIIPACAAVAAPAPAAGPPIGGCPASFEPGLVTVEFALHGRPLEDIDPSMDPNGDGYTCLNLIAGEARGVPFHSPESGTGPPAEGDWQRATSHDNVITG
jgi:hypothetical protein